MVAIIFIIASIILILIVSTIGGIINSKKLYSCPYCGHIFNMKWYMLMFKAGPMVGSGDGELKLKCPSCNKVDFCQHTTRRIQKGNDKTA